MNNPTLNLLPSDACGYHLIGLMYVLAGDLESSEALETLLRRWRAINWTDPAFIQFSEEMRAGMPNLTPDQESALQPSPLAIINALSERLAQGAEAMASTLPAFSKAVERFQKVSGFNVKLLDYIGKMTDLHIEMRDRLEMLDVDVSPYALPDLPSAPEL